MAYKYFSHSLGCKVNAYETSALGKELESKGYSLSSSLDADIIIINTCSVTSTADQKSRQHIRSYRRENPNAIIVVMGCYSQKHGEEALSCGANIVLGASMRSKVLPYIEEFQKNKLPILDIKPNLRKEEYEELGFSALTENARAYLKIQDGCDNFCSYCYIPQLRGNSRSRAPREALKEAKFLIDQGYKEIVLTGIHIGAYGKDLDDGQYRLCDLIEDILQARPNLFRLRISSIEESEIDDRFLETLRRYPQIADHLHIPLQSGSSSVLKRMRRKYDTEGFLEKLERIRKVRPDIAITTDVIAGFPEESEEEWLETMEFCKRCRFAQIHVFPFSCRPGTLAANMKQVDPSIKKKRTGELIALSNSMREEYKKRFYGRSLGVLFEEYSEKDKTNKGHTSNYLLVQVPGEKSFHNEIKTILYNDETSSD